MLRRLCGARVRVETGSVDIERKMRGLMPERERACGIDGCCVHGNSGAAGMRQRETAQPLTPKSDLHAQHTLILERRAPMQIRFPIIPPTCLLVLRDPRPRPQRPGRISGIGRQTGSAETGTAGCVHQLRGGALIAPRAANREPLVRLQIALPAAARRPQRAGSEASDGTSVK